MKEEKKWFGFLPRKIAIWIIVSGIGVAGFYVSDFIENFMAMKISLVIAAIGMGAGTAVFLKDVLKNSQKS
jgi:hypothetical protein